VNDPRDQDPATLLTTQEAAMSFTLDEDTAARRIIAA